MACACFATQRKRSKVKPLYPLSATIYLRICQVLVDDSVSKIVLSVKRTCALVNTFAGYFFDVSVFLNEVAIDSRMSAAIQRLLTAGC